MNKPLLTTYTNISTTCPQCHALFDHSCHCVSAIRKTCDPNLKTKKRYDNSILVWCDFCDLETTHICDH